jgi:hypothetical protein
MKEQFKGWKKYIDSFNVQLNKKNRWDWYREEQTPKGKKTDPKIRENNPDVE